MCNHCLAHQEFLDGETITVAEKSKMDILRERYPALIGNPITITDAAKKYDVDRRTVHKWRDKGYIAVITPGYGMTVDEADVAYCVDTYRDQAQKGYKHGKPLFDEDGLPYELKHPKLSKRRKEN